MSPARPRGRASINLHERKIAGLAGVALKVSGHGQQASQGAGRAVLSDARVPPTFCDSIDPKCLSK